MPWEAGWIPWNGLRRSDSLLDRDICRRWGELTARAQRAGRPVNAMDGLIAVTALHHGLQVMTRDTADFEPTGVSLFNPGRA